MPLRPALLATLAAAAAAEFPPGSLPACLNSSRRIFLDSAQLRIYEKPGPGGPKKVFAFEVLGGDECKARVRVNTKYAVTRGIQGTAHPDATIDMCAAKAHLDALRAKSHLFWDGTAPDEKAWHEAFLKHDGRARGGELHRMVVAHQRGASKAAQLGFAAARDAWRRYPRCAVVGGAPSLGKASNGAEIDAHDAVLRFNDHPSGGAYSRTAGNVTTFRFLNSLYAGQPSPEPAARVLQVCATEKRFDEAMTGAAKYGHTKRHLIDPEVFRTFYAHFGSGGLTGALGVWFALSMCDQVSLYGFSSPCELGTKYTHYHSATRFLERVQVNTVKVVLWMHALRCMGVVRWAPPDDGDGFHWCSVPPAPPAASAARSPPSPAPRRKDGGAAAGATPAAEPSAHAGGAPPTPAPAAARCAAERAARAARPPRVAVATVLASVAYLPLVSAWAHGAAAAIVAAGLGEGGSEAVPVPPAGAPRRASAAIVLLICEGRGAASASAASAAAAAAAGARPAAGGGAQGPLERSARALGACVAAKFPTVRVELVSSCVPHPSRAHATLAREAARSERVSRWLPSFHALGAFGLTAFDAVVLTHADALLTRDAAPLLRRAAADAVAVAAARSAARGDEARARARAPAVACVRTAAADAGGGGVGGAERCVPGVLLLRPSSRALGAVLNASAAVEAAGALVPRADSMLQLLYGACAAPLPGTFNVPAIQHGGAAGAEQAAGAAPPASAAVLHWRGAEGKPVAIGSGRLRYRLNSKRPSRHSLRLFDASLRPFLACHEALAALAHAPSVGGVLNATETGAEQPAARAATGRSAAAAVRREAAVGSAALAATLAPFAFRARGAAECEPPGEPACDEAEA